MKNLIRLGLAAAVAGALSLAGAALAQQGAGGGAAGPGSSDTATGGGGPSASSGSTIAGPPSAGQKLDEKLQGQLERIHATNRGAVQLAQLGITNAQSSDVRRFARQMQSDHRLMAEELDRQARNLGVSLEGKTFQKEQQAASKEMQKLQSKSGKDFDEAFVSQMVKGHQAAVKVVGDAAKLAEKEKQTELASLLATDQARMQGHLNHAKHLQQSFGQTSKQKQGTGSSQ